MDRFQSMRIFVAVAEQGGFAVAARALDLSPPAVTRAISGLEDRLGTRLFVRTTRIVRLTESGARFLQDAQRLLADLEEAEAAAAGTHATPTGELRVTAPMLFGRLFVAPILGDFLDSFPRVGARTLFVDRVVNLVEEGLDVAIRIGHLPDSSLIAARVGTVRSVMVAAPAYLTNHGRPRHPSDLADHRLIQALAVGAAPDWAFHENGKPLSIRLPSRLHMNTNDAVIELVARGWGLSRLLSYQVAADVAAGRLEIVLPGYEAPPLPIHIVHQEGHRVSAKVRAFVDFMVARLRADPRID